MSHASKYQTKSSLLLTALVCLAGCQPNQISLKAASPTPDCARPLAVAADAMISPSGTTRTRHEIESFVQERMAELNVPGASIAIIQDSTIVFHKTFGLENTGNAEPVTNCTIFQGASITKPLFGYFVMTFVEEGLLDLDRPLYEYLPYPDIANDERYKTITARMALTHQTGFPNWRTDYADQQLFIQFEPGTGYHYSGEGYQYLALVLQEIAGVDAAGLERLFQQRVARPAGQTHTQIVPDSTLLERTASPHRDGTPIIADVKNSFSDFGAAYGVHSESQDFAKWLITLTDQDGLSEAGFAEFYRPQNVPIPNDEPLRQLGLQDYALGFAVHDLPFGRRYIHGGNNPGFSSLVSLDPQANWGVVIFTNADQAMQFSVEVLGFLNVPSQKGP